MLYEKTSKAWKWWIEQQCPSGYKWVPKTKMKWVPKVRNENVNKKVSFAIDNASRITNIVQLILFIVDSGCTKHMTDTKTQLCPQQEVDLSFRSVRRFSNARLRVMLRRGIDLKNSLALGAQLGVFIFSSPLLPHKSLFQSIHLDVKTAFLNGPLKEEVYVAQPDGFVDPDHPEKVYSLRKALYGLKQAPRAWYDELSNFLMSKGFTKGTIDPTLFTIRYGEDILLVQIYVDDIIFRTSDPLIPKSWMSKKQDCTTMSLAKAEYVALSAGCAQVMWMRTQLKDYGFNYNKIQLYCDSQSAIAI
ncbi:retrovirus-related pol polyprotein from transposon TNT 1-94 [Tanacetum coccineum]